MLAGEVTETTTGFNQFFLLPAGCEQCPSTAATMDPVLVSILVTNFRVVITHIKHKSRAPIAIPLMLIDCCRSGKNGDSFWLDILTKHVWCFRIAVLRDPKLIILMQKTLERMMPRTLSQLFCFDHFAALQSQAKRIAMTAAATEDTTNTSSSSYVGVPPSLLEASGVYDTAWGVFSLERELRRMVPAFVPPPPSLNASGSSAPSPRLGPAKDPLDGTFGSLDGSKASAVFLPPPPPPPPAGPVDLSTAFQVMPLRKASAFATYPYHILLPAKATEELIERVAHYRHNGRIPSISWIHGVHGAVVARAAQPKTTSATYAQDDQALCGMLNMPIVSGGGAAGGNKAPGGAAGPARNNFFVDPTTVSGTTSPATTTTAGKSAAARAAAGSPQKPPALFPNEPPPRSVSPLPTSPVTAKPPASIVDDGFEREDSISGQDFVPTGSLEVACKKAVDGRKLIFADCRSRAAAVANFAKGGGTELPHFYDRAETIFLQLDNIHGVRNSFERLTRLCAKLQAPAFSCPQAGSGGAPGSSIGSSAAGFLGKLEATEWPLLTQKLLWASWRVSEFVHSGESVLVHCSDGWDRTAQVVSLSMLLLDAHFRTIEGFCGLVVREWLQLGHRFADRCFHERFGDDVMPHDHLDDTIGGGGCTGKDAAAVGVDFDWAGGGGLGGGEVGGMSGQTMTSTPKSQVSPIFLQFLDAVYQLLRMFPSKFEFTPRFLLHLTDHVYNCRFGTFLFNSHRSRSKRGGVTGHTASVWGDLELLLAAERQAGADPKRMGGSERLINPFYIPYCTASSSSSAASGGAAAAAAAAAMSSPAGSPPRSPASLNPPTPAAVYQVPAHLRERLIPSFQAHRYQFWTACYARYVVEDAVDSDAIGLEPDHLSPLIDGLLYQVCCMRGQLQPLVVLASLLPVAPFLPGAAPPEGALLAKRLLFRDRDAVVLATAAPSPAALDPVTAAETVLVESDDDGTVVVGLVDANASSPSCELLTSYVPRSEASRCELCGAEFTFFFRRHTCRRCCRAMCGNCGNTFIPLPRHAIQLYEDRMAAGPVRVCVQCHQQYAVPSGGAACAGPGQAAAAAGAAGGGN